MASIALRLGLITGLLLGLACSGSGGGGGDTEPASITQGSSLAIGSAVVRATFLSGDLGDIVEASLPPDTGAVQAATQIPGRDVPASLTRAAFGPGEVDCDDDGSVILSGDVDDPDTYSTGDVVNGDFMLCDFGTGFVYDGGFGFTVVSLAGDLLGDSFDVTLDLVMDLFDIDDGVNVLRADGDGTLELDTTNAPIVTSALDGDEMTLSVGGDSFTLRDYTSDLEVDSGPMTPTYVFASDGRMTSSEFSGEVFYQTTIDFEGSGDDPPSVGEMVITGAFDATITVDPQNDTDVDLLIDLDGNGGPDVLIGTTWAALGL